MPNMSKKYDSVVTFFAVTGSNNYAPAMPVIPGFFYVQSNNRVFG